MRADEQGAFKAAQWTSPDLGFTSKCGTLAAQQNRLQMNTQFCTKEPVLLLLLFFDKMGEKDLKMCRHCAVIMRLALSESHILKK